jgi:hypothetical protein
VGGRGVDERTVRTQPLNYNIIFYRNKETILLCEALCIHSNPKERTFNHTVVQSFVVSISKKVTWAIWAMGMVPVMKTLCEC